jgi:hypothetical protein
MAAIAAFEPPYLIVIAGVRTIATLQKSLQLKAFIQDVTAAVWGGGCESCVHSWQAFVN